MRHDMENLRGLAIVVISCLLVSKVQVFTRLVLPGCHVPHEEITRLVEQKQQADIVHMFLPYMFSFIISL